jgi:surfeit locus 1 family protein
MVVKLLFSRRWIIATLMVLVAVAVMIRLGFWQLDRLEQKRNFNQQVLAVKNLGALDFREANFDDLDSQIYRAGYAVGEYDFSNQVILSNQSYQDTLGVHLLTPMLVENTGEYVLVDRGWVPFEDYQNGQLDKYDQPGIIDARGIIVGTTDRVGVRSCLEAEPPPGEPLVVWCVDLEGIQKYLPYTISSVYLIREAIADEAPPVGTTVKIEITEGPHMGYAVQWFSFALVLLIGYPFYVAKDHKAREQKKSQTVADSEIRTDPALE